MKSEMNRKLKNIMKRLQSAMKDRVVVEFFYIDKNGDRIYYAVAPVCIHLYENKYYLIGIDRQDYVFIFDCKRIDVVGHYWATYSLPEDFDQNAFMKKYFDINKTE